MNNRKRLAFYLILNILVSAGTMWVVFNIGMARFPEISQSMPTPVGVSTTIPLENSQLSAVNQSILPGQLEISLVIGTGDLATERVLIKHIGDQEINMSRWQLVDEQNNIYTFPILTLFSGAAVSVNSRAGTLTVIDMYWGQNEAVWSIGELVKLIDPSGTIQAQYLIP